MKTIDQVLDMFPDTTEKDWHQHKNGLGWVANTAKVEESVYIGPYAQVLGNALVLGNARVSGNAQVLDNAQVLGNAQVYGSAWVFGSAQVSGNALVLGDARVYGNARVFGNAQVSDNAQVFGNARVSGNAWEVSPLYIQGSKHSMTLASFTEIAIGCHLHTIKFWKDNCVEIGQAEGYNKAEIEEYTGYIRLAEQYAARVSAKK